MNDREPLRWPWPALDGLTGGLMPGTVWYVCGFSGLGKSTFIRSAILGWAAQGVAVDVLPLETTAAHFMIDVASLLARVDPGLIASGDYKQRPDGEELRERVAEQWRRAKRDLFYDVRPTWAWANPVRVHDDARIDLAGLWRAAKEAKERDAKALIVDHIDHIVLGGNLYESSVAVNEGALDIAKSLDLTMILMSQANADALRGNRDHLAKYAPLRETSILMGIKKLQIATGVLGLFRPLKDGLDAETIKRAREGTEPPSSVLLPGAVGVSLLKSRSYGSRAGQRVLLGWKHGEVVDYEALPYSLR